MRKRSSIWLSGLALLVSSALVGCPDKPETTTTTQPAGKGGTKQAVAGKGTQDPLQGSVFKKEEVFEIYAAERTGGDTKRDVLKKYRLLGEDAKARNKAYERALKLYAAGDPKGWSEFTESLPE